MSGSSVTTSLKTILSLSSPPFPIALLGGVDPKDSLPCLWLNIDGSGLVQVLCRSPQLLWIQDCNCNAMHIWHHFQHFSPTIELCILSTSFSLSSGRGDKEWYWWGLNTQQLLVFTTTTSHEHILTTINRLLWPKWEMHYWLIFLDRFFFSLTSNFPCTFFENL